MKQRIITGIIIFLAILAILFLAEYIFSWFYDILVVLLMLMAGYEMRKAIAAKFGKPGLTVIIVYVLLGYAAFRVADYLFGRGGITSFFSVLAILIILSLVYNMFSQRQNLSNVLSTTFCMVYPVSIMVYLLALNYIGEPSDGLAFTNWQYDVYASGEFVPNYSAVAITSLLACASMTDIMAFFVGSAFKGPKLAPHISPKKTVSGAVGGIIGGLLGAGIVFGLGFTGFMGITPLSDTMWKNILLYFGLGLGIAIMTEIGDLVASYVKRYCEIKDYGAIFPGHGGILDRIDGIMLASVYAFAYFFIIIMVVEYNGAAVVA